MTPAEIKERLNDWGWLRAAVQDRNRLALLPQCEAAILALPSPCQPFQARWLLACTDEVLKTMREMYPEIVAGRRGGGVGYLYVKRELCRRIGRMDLVEAKSLNR